MALPIIESPKYEVKIPSTGKKLQFRPFLVKEEKVLMIALESTDQTQIMTAIKEAIKSCTYGKIDTGSLTMFDLEYLFLKLRSKSVGEIVKLKLACTSCKKATDVDISIDTIEIDMTKTPSNKIKLNDKIGVVMRWPKVDLISELATKTEEQQKESVYDVIIGCIESVYDTQKVYPATEQTHEEMVTFIESLNSTQIGKIQAFIEAMPKLQHDVKWDCAHCKVSNSLQLKGLQNFFSSPSPITVS